MPIAIKDWPDFARQLASRWSPGIPILLDGPLGAGKTTLARALLAVVSPDVSVFASPSFPIMLAYPVTANPWVQQCSGHPVWHMDLYRLHGPQEGQAIGLMDTIRDHLCVIEWPQRLQGIVLPIGTQLCRLDFVLMDPDKRHVDLTVLSHPTVVF